MRAFFQSRQLPFWLLTIGVMVLLVLPMLIQDGMFMDAMLYTSVAKNLGNDIGTFWNPEFGDMWMKAGRTSFHEQPPLVFNILGQFFRWFGNSMYVERGYVMLTTAISAFLIHKIWILIPHASATLKRMSWLPVLLWITFPVVMWTHQQMMCENTLELFILGAIYFTVRSYYWDKAIYLGAILVGCCIFLASLAKGVPGLFPIASIPVFWLVYKKFSFLKAAMLTILVVAVPVGIYAIMMLNPEAKSALNFYFNERLMGRISADPVTMDRFQLVKELFLHLLVVAGFIGAVYGVFRMKRITYPSFDKKATLYFFLIGVCGSIPLMITLVQRGFYMTPAMPFFAIAAALVLAPAIALGVDKMTTGTKKFKLLTVGSILVILAGLVLTISNVGKTLRDHSKLELVHWMETEFDERITIEVDREMKDDDPLECYLMRYAGISVDATGRGIEYDYFLSKYHNNAPFSKGTVQQIGGLLFTQKRKLTARIVQVETHFLSSRFIIIAKARFGIHPNQATI